MVCYERHKTGRVKGPTFVVLRPTERAATHCSLSDAAAVVCKEERSSSLKNKVCLLNTTLGGIILNWGCHDTRKVVADTETSQFPPLLTPWSIVDTTAENTKQSTLWIHFKQRFAKWFHLLS